jgi:hypothetical protein
MNPWPSGKNLPTGADVDELLRLRDVAQEEWEAAEAIAGAKGRAYVACNQALDKAFERLHRAGLKIIMVEVGAPSEIGVRTR